MYIKPIDIWWKCTHHPGGTLFIVITVTYHNSERVGTGRTWSASTVLLRLHCKSLYHFWYPELESSDSCQKMLFDLTLAQWKGKTKIYCYTYTRVKSIILGQNYWFEVILFRFHCSCVPSGTKKISHATSAPGPGGGAKKLPVNYSMIYRSILLKLSEISSRI